VYGKIHVICLKATEKILSILRNRKTFQVKMFRIERRGGLKCAASEYMVNHIINLIMHENARIISLSSKNGIFLGILMRKT
jgi:hypothetical protein